MSERLTPEQIASTYKGGVKALRRILANGYVIVHPDDAPRKPETRDDYDLRDETQDMWV